ncbi:DUF58 domain-containing protein [Akkermansiaceae bacterium]|nr:DUF58 domain-containing protein [Akkermansiaceae bacterium]
MTLTPRGAAFLGASLALFVAGLLRIDGPLISLGLVGLILLGIVFIFGRWNLSKLQVRLHAPARVFADTPMDLRLSLENHRSFFDTYGIDIQLELSRSARIPSHVKWAAAGSSASSKLRGSIPNRGAVSLHPCLLSSSFPLGIFTYRKRIVVSQEILVFPKALVPKEFFASGEFDDAWHGEGFQTGDAPGEPRGIRPFRPGDPAKRLHWPATIRSLARGRAPRVREFDPPGIRPRKATVIFHSFGTDGTLIRTDLFERGLSLLCGTLRHLRSMGVPANFTSDFLAWKSLPTFQSSAWSEVLTILARAERADDTEAHNLVAAVLETPPEDALVIISDMPPAAWSHILPNRKALIVDIQQHKFGKRSMNFRKAPTKTKSLT